MHSNFVGFQGSGIFGPGMRGLGIQGFGSGMRGMIRGRVPGVLRETAMVLSGSLRICCRVCRRDRQVCRCMPVYAILAYPCPALSS